jgi:hypothetical protein
VNTKLDLSKLALAQSLEQNVVPQSDHWPCRVCLLERVD